jgi:hypothetical protein
LTAQAVPPDEHPWIEQFGCTRSYRALRDGIRAQYRRWYPLTRAAGRTAALNPGAATVSKLSCEPRAALAVIEAMLAPLEAGGRLRVRRRCVAVAAEVDRDAIRSVLLRYLDTGEEQPVEARYVLDATETGDLLPLAGAEHVTGFESRADTGEPHAPAAAQPGNHQAVTVCFALDHVEGADGIVERPDGYERWRDEILPGWPDRRFSWRTPDPKTGAARTHSFVPNPDDDPLEDRVDMRAGRGVEELWRFRRVAARRVFEPGAYPSDITIVNWPMVDYTDGPLYGQGEEAAAAHRDGARRLSLAFLHWLQTEAPRPDGRSGWPGLRLRPDVVGTPDGLAKQPYVRESRRLRAATTVREQDVSADVRGAHGAVRYEDTVGIGAYRIDLHPSTGGDAYLDIAAHPFQIPLGCLLPVRLGNLVAAAKNIGTTHITNGCYRLHPVEWNVGEAAGALAAFCVREAVSPQQVHCTPGLLGAFQDRLAAAGVELAWPAIGPY